MRKRLCLVVLYGYGFNEKILGKLKDEATVGTAVPAKTAKPAAGKNAAK